MYRIRFHGRGGEGMKTSSRILGSSFFLEGFQVQDAPRYGAERRGAPMFAYVRADHKPIYERGPIHSPGLIVIADESLLHITPQTVLEGATENTVFIIITEMNNDDLHEIIRINKKIITINPQNLPDKFRYYLSSITAAASARITGKISLNSVLISLENELQPINSTLLLANTDIAEKIYRDMESHEGTMTESDSDDTSLFSDPDFITVPLHKASAAVPAIRSCSTSVKSPTGSWRTTRPVIDYKICTKCMLCSVYCPDSVIIKNGEGFPEIDYDHCKGCLICSEVCPAGAIKKLNENLFRSKAV